MGEIAWYENTCCMQFRPQANSVHLSIGGHHQSLLQVQFHRFRMNSETEKNKTRNNVAARSTRDLNSLLYFTSLWKLGVYVIRSSSHDEVPRRHFFSKDFGTQKRYKFTGAIRSGK